MKNNKVIIGVDEVGRGCLAGPVVSAAVMLKDGIDFDENLYGLLIQSNSMEIKLGNYLKN